MKKMNRKGFTIVELVIVIAVIAILAGVLIPTFSGIVQKANDSKDLQEARNAYTEYLAVVNAQPAANVYAKGGSKYFKVEGNKMDNTADTPTGDYVAISMNGASVVIDCSKEIEGGDHKACTVCKGQNTVAPANN